MANYTIPVSSPFIVTGDDAYGKPLDTDFSGVNWTTDVVSAVEVASTGIYEITLDDTKGYALYRNEHIQSFTADAGTDVITAASHGLLDGETLRFQGTDLPAPLAQGTLYYIRDAASGTFKVSLTAGGTAVDITDAGTGTMTFTAPGDRSIDDTLIGTVPIVNAAALTGEGSEALVSAIVASEVGTNLAAIKAKTDLVGTIRSLIRW